jgi:hypothetical protein
LGLRYWRLYFLPAANPTSVAPIFRAWKTGLCVWNFAAFHESKLFNQLSNAHYHFFRIGEQHTTLFLGTLLPKLL